MSRLHSLKSTAADVLELLWAAAWCLYAVPVWLVLSGILWMTRRLEKPEPDDERVGMTLVNVVYGVVLAIVFEAARNYRDLPPYGWSQLAIAATAVTLSWIGWYNNRFTYQLWRPLFINIPLIQYGISVSLAAAYFAIVATAELPGSTTGTTASTGGLPKGTLVTLANSRASSASPEALLVFVIFAAYLIWDVLEVTLLTSARYPAIEGDDRRTSTAMRAIIHLWWTFVFPRPRRCYGRGQRGVRFAATRLSSPLTISTSRFFSPTG